MSFELEMSTMSHGMLWPCSIPYKDSQPASSRLFQHHLSAQLYPMKLASFLTLASLTVCAFAQTIEIGYPYHNTQIKPGGKLTVQVNRPDTLTGSQEVAIVISLLQCPKTGHCLSPFDILGTTLYAGPYDPQFPTVKTPQDVPQQNFTVNVPSFFETNRTAQLAVSHLSLVGAGPFGLYEIKNVTLKVH